MTQPTRPTDTERAANWAIEATREGRFELAAALIRIAGQAFHSQRPAPIDATYAVAAAVHAAPYTGPRLVPVNGTMAPQDVEQVQPAAATTIMTAPTRDNRRCEAMLQGGANDCHGAVGWDHVNHRWYHVDPELDQDHYPAVREG